MMDERMDVRLVQGDSPTVAMLSRSSRLYIRIFGDASPVRPAALLFASFPGLVSPLAVAVFALEDAILCDVSFGGEGKLVS